MIERKKKSKVVSSKSQSRKLTLQDLVGTNDDAKHESSDEESDESDDEDRETAKENSSSKSRKRSRRKEEAELSAKENSMAEGKQLIETADDFERELVSAPNSSMLWIRYMAYHVAQTEIDSARKVAERALKKINFREEDEKQNVLTAYMKIEYKYGSKKSLEKLFARVVQHWDPKHANYALADIYIDGKEYNEADLALKRAVKASKGQSRGAWLRRISLKMDRKESEEAHNLVQEAIRILPKRKHVRTLMEFARYEYSKKEGSVERARTVCEGLVSTYPKRSDIWHQYIDAEQKYGKDLSKVRKLFERAVTLKISAKKMKTFFKKWLTFETEHGDETAVETVKSKAREFVESLSNR